MSLNPREAVEITKHLITSPDFLPAKDAATVAFFTELLKSGVAINSIYYPGVGIDFTLDRFFKPHQIFYLDREPKRIDVKKGHFGLTMDIPDGLFDAVFLQDAHERQPEFTEILRTLKKSGILIYSLWKCGEEPKDSMTIEAVASHRHLSKTELVKGKHPFMTLVKK